MGAYWLYFFEFAFWQILIGFFFGNKPGEGRNGAFLGLIFSGPLTYLSYYLDDKIKLFKGVNCFGVAFLIFAILLVVYAVYRKNKNQ